MTKTEWLLRAAVASLFAGWASNASAAEPQFVFDATIGSSEAQSLQSALASRWHEWEAAYSAAGESSFPLTVRRFRRGEDPGLAGSTLENEIRFRDPKALEHELAHVFVSHRCPAWTHSPLIQEALALSLTRDFQRVEAASPWLLFDEARSYLGAHTETDDPKKYESAIARVLTQNVGRYEEDAQETLRSCATSSEKRLFGALGLAIQGESAASIRYLVMDGRSGRILEQNGDIEKPAPTGSALKPLLLASFPLLKQPIRSRTSRMWACPHVPAADERRVWSWKEALPKSCNGYFLDHSFITADSWREFLKTTKSLSLPIPPKSREGLVGILPLYQLNLEQMARAYRYVREASPEVISQLAEVPKSGTLADGADAKWLAGQGALVKTGSVRGKDSVPLHSWMIALFPDTNLIAVVEAEGIATRELGSTVKSAVTPYLGIRGDDALVQVMGNEQPEHISIRCVDHSSILERKSGGAASLRSAPLRTAELIPHAKYKCLSGPISARSLRSGDRERLFYGELTYSPRPAPRRAPSHAAREDLNARAHDASSFVLRTSEFEYVYGTIASEYPNGSSETLKALALAIRENERARLGAASGPICDTTNCQVFANRDLRPSSAQGRRITAAILGTLHLRVEPSRDWFPFSLGGTAKWEAEIARSDVERAFHLQAGLDQIDREPDGHYKLRSSDGSLHEITCEEFRNSLHLKSCPTSVSFNGQTWKATGVGEGHGKGLDLELADALAGSGLSSRDLVKRFYDANITPESPSGLDSTK